MSNSSTIDCVTPFVPHLHTQSRHAMTTNSVAKPQSPSILSPCASESPLVDSVVNSSGHNNSTLSSTPVLSAPIVDPLLQVGNTHPMVTQFKVDIY